MDDLISRQAVLDYIDSMPFEVTEYGYYMIRRVRLTEYIADTLPSAIVRCKDCVKREFCRTSTVWAVSPDDNWYCAYGERKEE